MFCSYVRDTKFGTFQEADNATTYEQIGCVEVDLAEYAAGEAMSRRYLLQDSKMNSHLQITVKMQLLKGDPMFKVPDAKRKQIGFQDVLADKSSSQGTTFSCVFSVGPYSVGLCRTINNAFFAGRCGVQVSE